MVTWKESPKYQRKYTKILTASDYDRIIETDIGCMIGIEQWYAMYYTICILYMIVVYTYKHSNGVGIGKVKAGNNVRKYSDKLVLRFQCFDKKKIYASTATRSITTI